jgi:tetratricopeptide (TPR) repeat protein
VRRPDIPESVTPDLPREVMSELRRHARADKDVARAMTIAGDALADDDVARALEYLRWAKEDAPRAPSIREALGIALYLAEDWAGALSELQAYRRMTGRTDQNHLIADCQRALGRPLDRIAEAVREMTVEDDGEDRVAEGLIVWASALSDSGDPAAGRAVLEPALEDVASATDVEEHHVRVWYVAGDLAEQDGDHEAAERWFAKVAEAEPEAYDVEERLERLR